MAKSSRLNVLHHRSVGMSFFGDEYKGLLVLTVILGTAWPVRLLSMWLGSEGQMTCVQIRVAIAVFVKSALAKSIVEKMEHTKALQP